MGIPSWRFFCLSRQAGAGKTKQERKTNRIPRVQRHVTLRLLLFRESFSSTKYCSLVDCCRCSNAYQCANPGSISNTRMWSKSALENSVRQLLHLAFAHVAPPLHCHPLLPCYCCHSWVSRQPLRPPMCKKTHGHRAASAQPGRKALDPPQKLLHISL